MKKVLAIALALVIALSMSAMAFAADPVNKCGTCNSTFADNAAFAAHVKECKPAPAAPEAPEQEKEKCGICGSEFTNDDLRAHIALGCDGAKTTNAHDHYAALSIKDLLTMIIDLAKSSMTQWGDIESIIIRLVDFVENMGTLAADKAEVLGAVEDLEAAFADVKIPGIDELLNQLKAKIKAMYAGEKATTVVETTVAEEPAETGSSSVAGIAAFAAISVAAAAAYVCTKKSK